MMWAQSLILSTLFIVLIQCLILCTQKPLSQYHRLIHGLWKCQEKDDSVHSRRLLTVSAYPRERPTQQVITTGCWFTQPSQHRILSTQIEKAGLVSSNQFGARPSLFIYDIRGISNENPLEKEDQRGIDTPNPNIVSFLQVTLIHQSLYTEQNIQDCRQESFKTQFENKKLLQVKCSWDTKILIVLHSKSFWRAQEENKISGKSHRITCTFLVFYIAKGSTLATLPIILKAFLYFFCIKF